MFTGSPWGSLRLLHSRPHVHPETHHAQAPHLPCAHASQLNEFRQSPLARYVDSYTINTQFLRLALLRPASENVMSVLPHGPQRGKEVDTALDFLPILTFRREVVERQATFCSSLLFRVLGILQRTPYVQNQLVSIKTRRITIL